jgi:hypothetical protein
MRRIEVVATIRDAYVFAVTHLGGVIGLIWVPMVLATIMGFFSLQRYYNDFIDAMASGNVAALGPSMLMMLGYLVAALLLYAVMFVAVVQLALGARSAPQVAHFAFGNLEWRMFRAFIAFIGVILALVIPAFVVAQAVFALASSQLPQAAGPALMLLIFYGVILLAMPRFFVLLPTIAVAENAPVLRRAWMLSAGNYWRLLAVLLAIFGPILLLFTGLEVALSGHTPPPAANASEEMQLVAAIMRARDVLPLISGLGFLISPLLVGLFAGASVSVWRALKDEPALDIAV